MQEINPIIRKINIRTGCIREGLKNQERVCIPEIKIIIESGDVILHLLTGCVLAATRNIPGGDRNRQITKYENISKYFNFICRFQPREGAENPGSGTETKIKIKKYVRFLTASLGGGVGKPGAVEMSKK